MDFLRHYLLTILIFLPLAGAALALVPRRREAVGWTAIGAAMATFAVSLLLLIFFDWHAGNSYGYAENGGVVQLVQRVAWIPSLGIQYLVGIDGLSFPLVMAGAFLGIFVCVAAWNVDRNLKPFMAMLLIMESGMLGVLLSLDFALFFIFFLVTVLAASLLIRLWGGPRRSHAAAQFLIYMLIGGLAILIALIGLYRYGGSLDLIRMAEPAFQQKLARLMGGAAGPAARGFFCLLMFGFLIAMAAVPMHSWANEALAAAPAPVAMALAGLFLNLGGYGIFRIAYPLLPEAGKTLWIAVAILGVLTVLYGAIAATAQSDFKRLAIFSSVSQMGLITLAAAMLTDTAAKGAVALMVARALVAAMIFFLDGMANDRGHQLQTDLLRGLPRGMPGYRAFALLALLAALPLPLVGAFVGQIMVLLGSFQAVRTGGILYMRAAAQGHLHGFVVVAWTVSILACAGIVPTAGYVIGGLRAFFGPPAEENASLPDTDNRELAVLTPLAAVLILLGIFPMPLILAFSDRTIWAIYSLLLKSHG